MGRGIQWNNLEFSGKISQAQLPIDTLSIRIKEKNNKDGVVKLLGVANINLSSLITQSNQWITLTGDLLDKDGKSIKTKTSSSSYQLRLRYYRDDQIPEITNIIEKNENKGLLQLNEISFHHVPQGFRKNLFVECQLRDPPASDLDWSHLTDILDFPDNSLQITWSHLTLYGNILEKSLESSLLLTLKQQNQPTDTILGYAEINLQELRTKTNQWNNCESIVYSQIGEEIGKCMICLRYRGENEEEEVVVPVAQQASPVEETPSIAEEHPQFGSVDSIIPQEVEVQDQTQEPPVDELLEEDCPAPSHLEQDEVTNYEERPPPTPSKEEISHSPRIGSWALMKDEDGNPYYYNTITGESSWHPPLEMEDYGDPPAQGMDGEDGHIRNGDWIQLQDDGGNFYWYNEVTGESSWELPSDDPELYALPVDHGSGFVQGSGGDGGAYASASAGGYTIEL